MKSYDIDTLLAPISDDEPCGPDLEYDPQFGEMERAAQGTSEQQFGDTIVAAEPPDWKEVRKTVEPLLERTKDMRVAAYFARCSLNLDGLLGFEFALRLLRNYLETFWDSVHPELDHSDNDDPTYRTNTLITFCDEATFLRELKETPLVSSRAMGQFSLRDIEHAHDSLENPPAPSSSSSDEWGSDSAAGEPVTAGATPSAIEAAFSDVSVEEIQATEEAVRLSAEHVGAIEQFVTEQVGVSNAVSLAPLQDILKEMNRVLVAQLERRGVYTDDESPEQSEEESAGPEGAPAGGQGPTAAGFSGRIESREQVKKALDAVCDFYERNEPSSPVPLLIRRAMRLASKSFLEILRDLAPDAVSQAEAWGGSSASGGGDGGGESSGAESASADSSGW